MKRRFFVVICALIGLNVVATTKSSVPDFAFPKQVIKNAEQNLAVAQKDGNGIQVIKSLMDYSLAEAAISNDNLPKVVAKITEIRDTEQSPAIKSLLNLLLAEVYSDIYLNDRYKYDSRVINQFGSDYYDWSGEQFKDKISSLIKLALSDKECLAKIPLTDYELIISMEKNSSIFYPTLYDFVGEQSINILQSIYSSHGLFPVSVLLPTKMYIDSPRYIPSGASSKMILDIYADLLTNNIDNIPALINIEIERLNYISQNCYSNQWEDAKARKVELLKELYKKYSSNQYSGDILLDLSIGDYSSSKEYYDLLSEFAKRFPDYYRIGCINDRIQSTIEPSLSVVVPNIVSPGYKIPVKISSDNLSRFGLTVYRLPKTHSVYDDSYVVDNSQNLSLPKVAQYDITFDSVAPFSCDTLINISLADYGCYIVVPTWKGQVAQRRQFFNVVRCTDMALGTITLKSTELFVVNPLTGAPVEKVDLLLRSNRNTHPRTISITNLGVTDKMGLFSLDKSVSGSVSAEKGEDKYANPIWINVYQRGVSTQKYAYSSTDLPIYHPGDTVTWVAVLYTTTGETHNLLPGVTQKAVLRNANYMAIDTLECKSDMYGRISGSFSLPADELTGQYQIEFPQLGYSSNCRFTVSYYKMPTFRFVEEKAMPAVPSEGAVTIKGKLVTYSGMTMDNVRVRMNLGASKYSFWHRPNSVRFYNDSVSTDSDGVFEFVLDKKLLDNSPAPDGLFTAQLSATSISGESVTTDLIFVRNKKYHLEANIPDAMDISDDVKISARIVDSDNQSIASQGMILFIGRNGEAEKIDCEFPNPRLNLSKLLSGEYTIKICSDYANVDTLKYDNIVLYRPNDKKSPSSKALWCTKKNATLSTDAKGRYSLLYATTNQSTHILYVLSDSANVYERKWLNVTAGMHKLDVALPTGVRTATMSLFTVKDFEEMTIVNMLKNDALYNKLDIKVESFRDRIIPGNEETWTFRTVDKTGKAVESAFILNMYNEALKTLAKATPLFNPRNSYVPSLALNMSPLTKLAMTFYDMRRSSADCISKYALPEFNTYGRGFVSSEYFFDSYDLGSVQMKGYRKMSVMNMSVAATAGGLREESEEESVFGAVADEAMADVEEDDTAVQDDNQSFEYREANVPLAFFSPMLITDDSGVLEFSFKVPNANTSWQFNATAFTDDVNVATFATSVFANKPVMVQPNLPRYLRNGDRAIIETTVANNSDEVTDINVNVAVFNPMSNSLISSMDTTLIDVPANSIIPVKTIVIAGDNTALGFRVKASTSMYADGEQAVIPVLSTISPLIDTKPFYIAPDSMTMDMEFVFPVDSANVTIQYCDNPVWYVITALPGLTDGNDVTSPQIASTLYSAALARGLMQKYPRIAQALEQWSKSDKSDSTLVSMLERNSELKNIILKATIWQREAMSDTERMQRLVLLLDEKNINNSITVSIAKLKKLNRNNNGWAWTSYDDEPSEWATYSVLTLLGKLNQLGYMPKDKTLAEMIKGALNYQQKCMEKSYKRSPKGDYTSYTMLRDLWPQYTPSLIGKKIIANNVQQLLKKWKSMNISSKADAAMILYKHGYPSMAKQVLKSISEYAVYEPSNGMRWPSVNESSIGFNDVEVTAKVLMAYSVIRPESDAIDNIRQWLILQKETRNWGESAATNDVIAAILLSSSNWLNLDTEFELKYNGKSLTVTGVDSYLGYINADVSNTSKRENRLLVTKQGNQPAWGAVYAKFKQNIAEVKASDCEALSVARSYFKQVGDDWVESTDFKVGDRVKVMLNVVVDRTLQYVTLIDDRAACFEPVVQTPERIQMENVVLYRENRDASTNMFITNLPKGHYSFTYELWVNNAGEFISGLGKIQSQYAPQISAHTSGSMITATK